MTRSHLLLVALTALLASSAQAGDIPVPERVFYPDRGDALERFRWFGERNTFSIKILGTEAVRAGIQVAEPSHDAEFGPVVALQVVGTTVGFFDTIYPIDNESLALFSLENGLLPVYTDSDFDERDYVTRLMISYDRANYLHTTIRIRPNTPDSEEIIVVPRDVTDDMGMIYDVRSRDLTPGNGYVYYTHDGDEFSRITITVTGIEQVFSDLLGYVECARMSWVVEPLETAPLLPFGNVPLPPTMRPDGDPYAVAVSYFTTDERRIIVGADIETSIGLMTIRLTDYQPPTAFREEVTP